MARGTAFTSFSDIGQILLSIVRWIATGHYPQTADAYRAKLAPNTFSIRSAYAPSKDAIEWSRAVLDAAEGERGAFRFRGQMIDEPVLRHARSVLQRVG